MNKYLKTGGVLLICACAVGILWTSAHHKKDVLNGTQKADAAQATSFPKTYEKQVSDTFTIQADVIVPENFDPSNLHKTTAQIHKIDQEAWKKRFLESGTEYQEHEYEESNREEKRIKGMLYDKADGWQLAVSEQCGALWAAKMDKIINYLIWDYPVSDGYNRDAYPIQGDLSFAKRDDAYQIIAGELESLGIPMKNVEIERCYNLPYQTLAEQEQLAVERGELNADERRTDWSSEDDAYYYYIWQTEQELPVYPCGHIEDMDPENIRGGIECCYSKDGIDYLNVSYWMDFKQEEETLSLLSFEDIIKTVEEKYGDVINDGMMTLNTCRLFEAPIPQAEGSYEVVPVWICKIQDGNMSNPIYLPINAVTGQEVEELEYE